MEDLQQTHGSEGFFESVIATIPIPDREIKCIARGLKWCSFIQSYSQSSSDEYCSPVTTTVESADKSETCGDLTKCHPGACSESVSTVSKLSLWEIVAIVAGCVAAVGSLLGGIAAWFVCCKKTGKDSNHAESPPGYNELPQNEKK